MSGDIEGTKRVRDALDFTLRPALPAFVEANMKARHGQHWLFSHRDLPLTGADALCYLYCFVELAALLKAQQPVQT
jgi:hypothetical protein